ncbi:hypothetical protein C4D60_Mb11t04760 [Musa balbisiana]|uniref:Homeobox domain-containing protein n=1 Tax=Musa balbisiana TaxID=52838 RepID=A0A4V4H5A5_MUSBA|nr:hypothetical protein C4D60_Mb11t04760 [Musa balbisiana]
MEDLFSIHPGILGGGETPAVGLASSCQGTSEASEVTGSSGGGGSDLTDLIKAQIANHPRYPSLLSAYIECQKVGAPPEVATLLEEIGRERYSSMGEEVIGSSEELCCGDLETSEGQECGSRLADQELKEMLLKKYSGYLSNLRKEFLKKRKKGKLPKDARLMLLDWWNTHYRWPYPTEEEKAKLAEKTGLDQKQINNWFINQRKRHWKPSDDMRYALMEGVSGGSSGTMLYFDRGAIGP